MRKKLNTQFNTRQYYPKEFTAVRAEMRWTEIEMQRSISVKRQEGCWQHKLSVSGQNNK